MSTLNNRAGSEIVYTSNVVNEYTAIGGAAPLYDACGNLTRDIHGYTYDYDNDNRVTQIKTNNDADEVAAYTCDALGRRIRKYDAVAAAAVRCYYDDQRVLLETDANDPLCLTQTHMGPPIICGEFAQPHRRGNNAVHRTTGQRATRRQLQGRRRPLAGLQPLSQATAFRR